MSTIEVQSGKLKKKSFILDEDIEERINEISDEFGIPWEKVVEMALNDYEKKCKEDEELSKLREKLYALQKEMFMVEQEWVSLHYNNLLLIHELKDMAINILGLLHQNRTLRGVPYSSAGYSEIADLAEHYLFMNPIKGGMEEEQ